MSDENIILQSMALFPTVLERIIIEYLIRKEIKFQPFNNNNGLIISDDGRTLSVKKAGTFAAISLTPFSQCRLRWKVELPYSGYVGIVFPNCKPHELNRYDIADANCVFISFRENEPKCHELRIPLPNTKDYVSYFFQNKYIVMEVDLINSTLHLCVDESDQMIDPDGKCITGKIPIGTDIPNLEQCFPFITLSPHCVDKTCATVTSYQ